MIQISTDNILQGPFWTEKFRVISAKPIGDNQFKIEAVGEGINLQFCWLMVKYDIPWNPNRLEQRLGRIHRYGQQHEVHIYNQEE